MSAREPRVQPEVSPDATRKGLFRPDEQSFSQEIGDKVDVQFNPESLKVTFSNQIQKPQAAGDQNGPAAIQYVGSGTTKMGAQLWFDSSVSGSVTDVRQLTKKVADFMTAKEITDGPGKGMFSPMFVRFNWGTFMFQGIMDAFEETVEFFSPDGVPQRASATFSLVQQAITFLFGQQRNANAPGNAPLTSAPQGSSLQSMAAAAGRSSDWQSIASANGIENPRMLATGQLIDMNADITGGVTAGVGTAALGNVSVGASATVGGSVGGSGAVSAGISFG